MRNSALPTPIIAAAAGWAVPSIKGIGRDLRHKPLPKGRGLCPISVLGTVPLSRAALRRLYHVRLDTPSASHGRSISLLPSPDALAFRALPVCFAERAACLSNHDRLCPCSSHFRWYRSTDRAMPATSESGSGSRPYASATSRFSACAMVSADTPRSPRQVAMNRSRFRPIPVWAMRGLRQLNGITDESSSSEYGLRRPQTVSALGCTGLRDRPPKAGSAPSA